jgi:hypothetical protein
MKSCLKTVHGNNSPEIDCICSPGDDGYPISRARIGVKVIFGTTYIARGYIIIDKREFFDHRAMDVRDCDGLNPG